MAVKTAVIGVDWGTSTLRAFRMGAEGGIAERRSAPQGILAVMNGDFAGVLEEQIGDWATEAPRAPVVMSGMIGSRQGWRETPYLSCPAGAEEIAGALTPVPWRRNRTVWIAPGLSCRHGVPDVMRGEEVQIMGALADKGAALEAGRHVICLPGTHGKWATVVNGAVTEFTTHMTGEVFDVLCKHSILGRLMAPAPEADTAWFGRGLERSRSAGGLLHHLFGARTLKLIDDVPAEVLRPYLSGLLIGHEVEAAAPDGPVHLLGAPELVALYRLALERRGTMAHVLDGDAVARGLFRLAGHIAVAT